MPRVLAWPHIANALSTRNLALTAIRIWVCAKPFPQCSSAANRSANKTQTIRAAATLRSVHPSFCPCESAHCPKPRRWCARAKMKTAPVVPRQRRHQSSFRSSPSNFYSSAWTTRNNWCLSRGHSASKLPHHQTASHTARSVRVRHPLHRRNINQSRRSQTIAPSLLTTRALTDKLPPVVSFLIAF